MSGFRPSAAIIGAHYRDTDLPVTAGHPVAPRRIFISHSTADRPTVQLVAERLEAHGLATWVSYRDIDGRAEYSDQIDAALRSATAVAVVISASANSSPEVLKEVELALKYKRIVFPILIEAGIKPEGGLAYHLASQNWLSWTQNPQAAIDYVRSTMEAIDPEFVDTVERPRPHLMTSMSIVGTTTGRQTLDPAEGWASEWGHQGATDASVRNAAQGSLPAGAMVDCYRISEAITASNHSVAYRAQSVLDGNSYFLKEFYPKDLVKSRSDKNGSVIWDTDGWWGTKTKAIKRRSQIFAAEGQILHKIRSKNVPAYVATLQRNRTFYLVSEFIPGETWAAYLDKHGQVTWRETYELLMVLLTTVAHCHSLNIYHCDIQPSNILITSVRPPVLVDFGAALDNSSAIQGTSRTIRAMTPGFSAPEIVSSSGNPASIQGVGPWTDLFSLGAVGFVSVTGRLPQIGDLGSEVNFLNAKHGAPSQLAAAIGWCLAIEPHKRPQNVADVLNVLDSVVKI